MTNEANKGNSLTIAQAYKDYFHIGAAVSARALPSSGDLAKTQFNSITAENEMKFSSVHPSKDQYTFEQADEIFNFAMENNLNVRGHTLVWHGQTGRWIFEGENGEKVDKETLYARMKEHIDTVVKRYAGKIYCWDVVNEAISDSDEEYLRVRSPYYGIVGSEEFIEKAFIYAHEADPKALLFYNDYNTEVPSKRERVYKLVKSLKDKGIPIHGVGLQAHYDIHFNPEELKKSIELFSSLGLIVHVTELDVSIYRFDERGVDFETPPQDRMDKQIELYDKLFQILRDHKDVVGSVTFWGLTDRLSWLNGFPVRRRNYPLLFDADQKPKDVFYKLIEFAK